MPCRLDSVGTILCYHTSNTILLNATLLLVYFFIMSKSLNFMSLFCVHVYVLYELFFVHNVVYLLSCALVMCILQ